jgi:hypothetical protein
MASKRTVASSDRSPAAASCCSAGWRWSGGVGGVRRKSLRDPGQSAEFLVFQGKRTIQIAYPPRGVRVRDLHLTHRRLGRAAGLDDATTLRMSRHASVRRTRGRRRRGGGRGGGGGGGRRAADETSHSHPADFRAIAFATTTRGYHPASVGSGCATCTGEGRRRRSARGRERCRGCHHCFPCLCARNEVPSTSLSTSSFALTPEF